jgi:alpha-tubulin suppressor-like RCC1 family protein
MDGSVSCWGANKEGELGNNSTMDSSTPVLVGGIAQATDLVAGMKHTCVVEGIANTVKCWGDNSLGQLGGFTGAHSTSPVSIIIPTK